MPFLLRLSEENLKMHPFKSTKFRIVTFVNNKVIFAANKLRENNVWYCWYS